MRNQWMRKLQSDCDAAGDGIDHLDIAAKQCSAFFHAGQAEGCLLPAFGCVSLKTAAVVADSDRYDAMQAAHRASDAICCTVLERIGDGLSCDLQYFVQCLLLHRQPSAGIELQGGAAVLQGAMKVFLQGCAKLPGFWLHRHAKRLTQFTDASAHSGDGIFRHQDGALQMTTRYRMSMCMHVLLRFLLQCQFSP